MKTTLPINKNSWNAVRRMMVPGHQELPKFRQLEVAIQAAIKEGMLSPGHRLPSERSIAEHFGVSLGTAQKAMTCLARDGFVTRARRRGTVIQGRTVSQEDIYVFRFKDPETGQFVEPLVRMLSVSVPRRRGPWNDFLRLDKVVRFERLMRVGLERPVYSEFFISCKHGAHLLAKPMDELHATSLHRLLGDRFRFPTVRIEHKLKCAPFSYDVCAHLMMPPKEVGLVWEIGGYTHGDLATSFQRIHLPAGHRAVEIESHLGSV